MYEIMLSTLPATVQDVFAGAPPAELGLHMQPSIFVVDQSLVGFILHYDNTGALHWKLYVHRVSASPENVHELSSSKL